MTDNTWNVTNLDGNGASNDIEYYLRHDKKLMYSILQLDNNLYSFSVKNELAFVGTRDEVNRYIEDNHPDCFKYFRED